MRKEKKYREQLEEEGRILLPKVIRCRGWRVRLEEKLKEQWREISHVQAKKGQIG